MIAADALAAYRRNQVITASPEKLVLLLYDEAIKSLKRGVASIQRSNIQETSDNLCRAQEIIGHLAGSLNSEVGGGLADNLAALYSYMLRLVTRANVEKDIHPLEEAVTLLSELRSGWQEALMPGAARSGTAG